MDDMSKQYECVLAFRASETGSEVTCSRQGKDQANLQPRRACPEQYQLIGTDARHAWQKLRTIFVAKCVFDV